MKIKRMVKRLLAVGAGATMLGATAMGAMAADLNNYPSMFVTDGTFNGFLVVGENAAAIDNLAMTDIAASMKYMAPASASSVTVEGDAWEVATSSKKLELANNNAADSSITGEQIYNITTFIGDEELAALADGTWSTNEQDYGYQQFLYFDDLAGTSSIMKYTENDDDETDVHFFIANSNQIARYLLEFTSTAQSDVTDSAGTGDTTGTYLDDFEDTVLNIMGKDYSVVQARRPASDPTQSIKLVLMAGAVKDTVLEGESKTYTVGGKEYEVTLSFVDSTSAKFTINGQTTSLLKDGETYVLADDTEIGVSEVLYQNYAGGIHSSTFYLGATKMELRDDNVTLASSTNDMRVGSEDIDGAATIITGTDNDNTFTISTIEVNLTAQDRYFVAANEKLSEVIAAADEEEEVLMAGGFDVDFQGVTEEDTQDLTIKTSSTRRYKLRLHDGDGKAVDIPIAYAEAQYNLTMGQESSNPATNSRTNQKRLMINESATIQKDDFFVLTAGTAADGSAKSYLLQYRSSDNDGKTSPKIKFKNEGSGEIMEYSVSSNNNTATIKLGGYSFAVRAVSDDGTDDFQIRVDLNGDGTLAGEGAGAIVNFIDSYGSQWAITDNTQSGTTSATGLNNGNYTGAGNSSEVDSVGLAWSVPNADDYDNFVPTTVTFTVTAGTSDPEVRVAQAGLTLLTPEGETEVSYGYTSMGAFIKYNQPSGDPQELTITYPVKQRLPQLFFTSGATTSSTSSGGSLTVVAVVDATKLDSEVASASAQNLIVVGGPCVNTVAAELLGNPAECTQGFTPGKARVKLFENANGNVAMLVAGYSGADTRLAGKVIAHRWQELSGDEVEVEGTTYSDATISAPVTAAAAVVEEVAEEAAE